MHEMVSYAVLADTSQVPNAKFEIRMIRRPAEAVQSLVKQYLDHVSRRDHTKIYAAIIEMVRRGPYPNPERYGDLGDGIYEIKVGQHRIPFFYAGRGIIVLTHGFFKTTQQAPPAEIRRARDLRELYNERYGWR